MYALRLKNGLVYGPYELSAPPEGVEGNLLIGTRPIDKSLLDNLNNIDLIEYHKDHEGCTKPPLEGHDVIDSITHYDYTTLTYFDNTEFAFKPITRAEAVVEYNIKQGNLLDLPE